MTHVASDPAVQRPYRPEPAPARAGAASDGSGAFEGMLDSAQEKPRPAQTERRDYARAPERTDAPKPSGRLEPRSEAQSSATDNAQTEQTDSKPATAPDTRQAKNGQPTDTSLPATELTETAAPPAVPVLDVALVLAAEVAVAVSGEPAPAAEDTETEAPVAADQPTDAAADADVTVTADAPKADATAVIAAVVAPPVPAPAPMPAADPAIGAAAVAAVEAQPVVPQARAEQGKAPVTADGDKVAAGTQAKAEAIATPAATVPAEESQETTGALATLSEEPKTRTPATDSQKADGKPKPEHATLTRPDGNEQPAAKDASNAADTTADQPKAPAPHQPRVATEHVAAARPATAEARTELPVTPAPSAQIGTATPLFPLPLTHALPHAISPLVALRVDNTADAALPVAGIAVEIVARATEGSKRFEIRLDPPELGRIDVRLDVDTNGKVTSRLVVERTETLDLLRRDAPQLERALQHAGLNTEGGLEFSLRDQNFTNRDQTHREAPATRLIVPDDDAAVSEAARRGYGRMLGLGGGVDIRV